MSLLSLFPAWFAISVLIVLVLVSQAELAIVGVFAR